MKTFVFTLFALISFSISAQHLALAEIPAAPLFKEAYAVNLSQVKAEMEYPEVCRNAHIEGKVFVQIQVSAKGEYMSHRIQKSSNRFFRGAVEKQIHKLTFSPASINGKQKGTWVPLLFEFTLTSSKR